MVVYPRVTVKVLDIIMGKTRTTLSLYPKGTKRFKLKHIQCIQGNLMYYIDALATTTFHFTDVYFFSVQKSRTNYVNKNAFIKICTFQHLGHMNTASHVHPPLRLIPFSCNIFEKEIGKLCFVQCVFVITVSAL